MNPTPTPSRLADLQTLPKTPRLPVLFLGHGSPMNAIEDNEYRQSWQALGQEFGKTWPVPQLILCISAHWLTEGWYLTAMENPKTIHDFGGFPQALFDQQYPVPGAPRVVAEISQGLTQPNGGHALGQDQAWGLDHGAWSVLKPMFPAANLPVVQLSMDYSRPPSEHFALGQQLKQLRERGVLIVGSGNIVHNLRTMRFGVPGNQAYDWAIEFDTTVAQQVETGDLAALANFQNRGAVAKQAHPSHEHYLPLLYAAGAVDAGEPVRAFNTSFQAASISMRSFMWGNP
jgi:4,5-DOPA dioxygenase extradiol